MKIGYRGALLASLGAFFVPLLAAAQDTGNGLLGACKDAYTCNLCTFVALIQNIINFAIMLSIPIAVALFAYAGVLYFTSAGSSGQVEKAHGIFKTAGIGFLIALTGWLIIDTLIHAVVKPNYFSSAGGNWYTISCEGERKIDGSVSCWLKNVLFDGRNDSTCQQPTTPTVQPRGTQTPSNTVQPASTAPPEGSYSDADARQVLAGVGLGINKGICAVGQTSGCTSLDGIRKETIDQIINLRNACDCGSFTITGGTEGGHADGAFSHRNGHKVDISLSNAALNSFIRSLPSIGTRSDGSPEWIDAQGNTYALEADHWDVTVQQVGIVKS